MEDVTVLRPQAPSLLTSVRRNGNLKCLILTGLIASSSAFLGYCRTASRTKLRIDYDAFPITKECEAPLCEDWILPSSLILMLYLLYLVECYYSKAHVLVRTNKIDPYSAYAHLEELRRAAPLIWWKALSYHYLKEQVQDVKNYSRISFQRVNSHLGRGVFFSGGCGWADSSPHLRSLEGRNRLLLLKIQKIFLFGNEAARAEFLDQREQFFEERGRLDTYLEMKEGLVLLNGPDPDPDQLLVWGGSRPQPWIFSKGAFWTFNILLLSWPFRLFLFSRVGELSFQVRKVFGVNYNLAHNFESKSPFPSITQTVQSRPGGLVPSYSQALLFRSASSYKVVEGKSQSPPSYEEALLRFPSTSKSQFPEEQTV